MLLRVALIGVICVLTGCGPSVGEVSGVVTFEGQPVPGGLITFRPGDSSQNSVAYELERDGRFKVELPIGEVSVCIDNRQFEPQPALQPAVPPGLSLPPEVVKSMQESTKESARVSDRWMKLPEKYYAIETSGIKFTVQGGAQEENIQFTK